MNVLKTPLSQETIAVLLTMGVRLYADSTSGKIFIHNRYWNNTSVVVRQAIERIVQAQAPSSQDAGEVANV